MADNKTQKKQTTSGGSFGNIWTGLASENPAILKAKAEKSKRDAAAAAYAKKVAAEKAAAIEKAKKK